MSGKCRSTWHIPDLLWSGQCKGRGKYPLALIGATVYATAKDHVTIEGVMEIKQGKLRGYDSYGMLCSGVELGLNEDLYPGVRLQRTFGFT